jgi:hypothetical protein
VSKSQFRVHIVSRSVSLSQFRVPRAAWRCRAIKVDAIVDLHGNLVTGLERKSPYDLSREVRILARAHHTFGGLTERWTDMFAAVLP